MVKNYLRWVGHAKHILESYPESKAEIARQENDIIYGSGNFQDNQNRRGGVGNPTQGKAIRMSSGRLQQLKEEVAAIEGIIAELRQSDDQDALDKLRMLEMLYFKENKTLEQAAHAIGVSTQTLGRWNGQIVRLLGQRLFWH